MYITVYHILDGLGPFLVTVHIPVTFFRVGFDFHWISYVKSNVSKPVKIWHFPIEVGDRDGAPEAVCAPAAGNGRRHRLGIPSGSFALVPELVRGRDGVSRPKCTSRVTTIGMVAGYPAHSS